MNIDRFIYRCLASNSHISSSNWPRYIASGFIASMCLYGISDKSEETSPVHSTSGRGQIRIQPWWQSPYCTDRCPVAVALRSPQQQQHYCVIDFGDAAALAINLYQMTCWSYIIPGSRYSSVRKRSRYFAVRMTWTEVWRALSFAYFYVYCMPLGDYRW